MPSQKQQDAESPQTQNRPTGAPGKAPQEKAPEHGNQATTEEFDREGMGVAAKE